MRWIQGRVMQKPASDQPADGVFVLEGEYWTITYGGTVVRLRDCKGLHYLAWLLHEPETGVAAVDLAGAGFGRAPMGPERARSAVTKRIRATVQNITRHHPSLGYHLATAVKTGQTCIYKPDPTRPIAWRTEVRPARRTGGRGSGP